MRKVKDDRNYGWRPYGYADLYRMLAIQEAEGRVS